MGCKNTENIGWEELEKSVYLCRSKNYLQNDKRHANDTHANTLAKAVLFRQK